MQTEFGYASCANHDGHVLIKRRRRSTMSPKSTASFAARQLGHGLLALISVLRLPLPRSASEPRQDASPGGEREAGRKRNVVGPEQPRHRSSQVLVGVRAGTGCQTRQRPRLRTLGEQCGATNGRVCQSAAGDNEATVRWQGSGWSGARRWWGRGAEVSLRTAIRAWQASTRLLWEGSCGSGGGSAKGKGPCYGHFCNRGETKEASK